jgi:hypothetical protein
MYPQGGRPIVPELVVSGFPNGARIGCAEGAVDRLRSYQPPGGAVMFEMTCRIRGDVIPGDYFHYAPSHCRLRRPAGVGVPRGPTVTGSGIHSRRSLPSSDPCC